MRETDTKIIRIYHCPKIYIILNLCLISFAVSLACVLPFAAIKQNFLISLSFSLLLFLFSVLQYYLITKKRHKEKKNLVEILFCEWKGKYNELNISYLKHTKQPIKGYDLVINVDGEQKVYFLKQKNIRSDFFTWHRDFYLTDETINIK